MNNCHFRFSIERAGSPPEEFLLSAPQDQSETILIFLELAGVYVAETGGRLSFYETDTFFQEIVFPKLMKRFSGMEMTYERNI